MHPVPVQQLGRFRHVSRQSEHRRCAPRSVVRTQKCIPAITAFSVQRKPEGHSGLGAPPVSIVQGMEQEPERHCHPAGPHSWSKLHDGTEQ